MPRALPRAAAIEKEQTATTSAWLVFLVMKDGDGTVLFRLVNNTADIVLGGNIYTAGNFTIQSISESVRANNPVVSLMIYDVDLALRDTLHDNNGLSGAEFEVRYALRQVGTRAVDLGYSHVMTVGAVNYEDDGGSVVFELSTPSPLTRRFPPHRYVAPTCRHTFRDALCKYDYPAATTCNHTITRCRELNNAVNYGGSPGVAEGLR